MSNYLPTSIFSKNKYLVQGLYELFGCKLINEHFVIIDLDDRNHNYILPLIDTQKRIIAFTSFNALHLQKTEIFGKITYINKHWRLSKILNTFLSIEYEEKSTKLQLSKREIQILNMFFKGVDVPGMSHILGVSPKTIYTHRRNLMRKLGCENRIILYKLFNL